MIGAGPQPPAVPTRETRFERRADGEYVEHVTFIDPDTGERTSYSHINLELVDLSYTKDDGFILVALGNNNMQYEIDDLNAEILNQIVSKKKLHRWEQQRQYWADHPDQAAEPEGAGHE